MSRRVTVHIERYGYVRIPRLAQELIPTPTTLSLYYAIRLFSSVRPWKGQQYQLTWAGRDILMATSRIESEATYSKCLRELKTLGLIEAVMPKPSKKELKEAGFIAESEKASGFAPNLFIVKSHIHVNLREQVLPNFIVNTLIDEMSDQREVHVHIERFGYAKVSKIVQAITALSHSAFSLYVAINQFAADKVWEGTVRRLAFPEREVLMKLARIGKSTYLTNMRQLREMGLIQTTDRQPTKADLIAAGLMAPTGPSRNSFATQIIFVPETIEVTLDDGFLSPAMLKLIERDIEEHGITELAVKPHTTRQDVEITLNKGTASNVKIHTTQVLRGTEIDTYGLHSGTDTGTNNRASQMLRGTKSDTHADRMGDKIRVAQDLRGTDFATHGFRDARSMEHTDRAPQKVSHTKSGPESGGLSTYPQDDSRPAESCVAQNLRHTDSVTRENVHTIYTKDLPTQESDQDNPYSQLQLEPSDAGANTEVVAANGKNEADTIIIFFEYLYKYEFQRLLRREDKASIVTMVNAYGYKAVLDAADELVRQLVRRKHVTDLPPIRNPLAYVSEILSSKQVGKQG